MVITKTPFRISFFGGGTDYPAWYRKHGGSVISTTIDKYCYIICRYLPPFFDHTHRIRYTRREETRSVEKIQHPSVRECLKFLRITEGIEMTHTSDLPAFSGIGSSSSFTVGLLHALRALKKEPAPSPRKLALDAIHVEQNLIRENVGSQDQTAAAYGGFNRIDFGGSEHIAVRPLAVAPETRAELQNRLILFFTGFTRNASEIAVEQIRRIPDRQQELHAMAELVNEAEAVLAGHRPLDEFGALLHESWLLKRSLTSKITTPLINDIYTAAREAGALGGKLLGAGGGGFMVFFVRPEDQPAVRGRLKHLLHVPFRFENLGSHIIHPTPESPVRSDASASYDVHLS